MIKYHSISFKFIILLLVLISFTNLSFATKNFDEGQQNREFSVYIIVVKYSLKRQGYILRGHAVGFIKTGSSVNDVAHELGHGAFKLEHTFDAIAKGSSNNLLDYSNNTHITKSQWLNIQNPSSELTWFDDEEDGSLVPLDSSLARVIAALKLKRNSKGRLVPPPPKPKSTFPNAYDKTKYHFVYLETNEFSEITNYGGYLYLVFYNASNIGAIQVQAPDFVEKSAGKEFLMCRYLADMLPPSIKGKVGLNVVVSDWWQYTHAKYDPVTEKIIVNDTLQSYLDHSNYGVGVSNTELMAASCLEAAQGIAYSLSTLLPMTCSKINLKYNSIKSGTGNNGSGFIISSIKSRLTVLKNPARPILPGENIPLINGKQTQPFGGSKFNNVTTGTYNDASKKYIWTIDDNGINIGLEQTPIGGNSVIKHTNLSLKAYSGGEVWFITPDKVHINAWSGRFGAGANMTKTEWEASIDAFKSNGYQVIVEPYK